MSFESKKVWITGASSGIGAALAVELSSRGATCILSARNVERLETVRQRCTDPDRHFVQALDSTDFDSHADLTADVEATAGDVDIMVLNAGIGQRGEALDTSLDVVRRIMDVNFTGTVSLAQHIALRMRERARGHIVVVSSVLGRISIPGSSSYSASKHALHGYFESLRAELHQYGVTLTLACPGYINTEISVHALQPDGSTFGVIDQNHTVGMDADVCARKLATAIQRRKPVFNVGGKETLAIPLSRWSPGLVRVFGRRYSRE